MRPRAVRSIVRVGSIEIPSGSVADAQDASSLTYAVRSRSADPDHEAVEAGAIPDIDYWAVYAVAVP
ncbi:hypothetical protein [Myceligenerans xiligouense]|uniref:hypothetical protein n=1 Tax=Myceligenerans xiligouense TaxID=253184 RepID=UPI000F4DECE3|nr:hypothetical protein [Myceligenerans xiligouense]